MDALATLPVRALVTLGTALSPDEVRGTDDVKVVRSAPHAEVLREASLLVTHCGHGTVTASLAHGVPIAGLPYPAADQPYLAARVQALGAGLAMDGESSPAIIKKAVRDLLEQPSFREAAGRLGRTIRAAPGPAGAADVLEQLAGRQSSDLKGAADGR